MLLFLVLSFVLLRCERDLFTYVVWTFLYKQTSKMIFQKTCCAVVYSLRLKVVLLHVVWGIYPNV